MSEFMRMMLPAFINIAITQIERAFPQAKGPEKYDLALKMLTEAFKVKIDPEVEEMIRAQVALMNALGVFKKK